MLKRIGTNLHSGWWHIARRVVVTVVGSDGLYFCCSPPPESAELHQSLALNMQTLIGMIFWNELPQRAAMNTPGGDQVYFAFTMNSWCNMTGPPSSFLSHFRQNSQNNIIPAFYTPLPTRRPLPPAPLSSHAAPLHHQLSLKPPVSTQRKRSVFAIVSTCGSSARRERFLVRDKCVKSLLATSVSLKTNSSQNASPTSPLRNLHLREMSAVRLSHC